jgi:hypothetical protein
VRGAGPIDGTELGERDVGADRVDVVQQIDRRTRERSIAPDLDRETRARPPRDQCEADRRAW